VPESPKLSAVWVEKLWTPPGCSLQFSSGEWVCSFKEGVQLSPAEYAMFGISRDVANGHLPMWMTPGPALPQLSTTCGMTQPLLSWMDGRAVVIVDDDGELRLVRYDHLGGRWTDSYGHIQHPALFLGCVEEKAR